MFTAYFDCSGSPADSVAVVVAGFVALDQQWVEFERNWKDCLIDFRVRSLHMRDYAHSKRDFDGWQADKQKRELFISRLINIIKSRVRSSFASAVVMDDYEKVNATYCLFEFSKPLTLTGATCIAKLHRWADGHNINTKDIAVVFEDGDRDKGDLRRFVKERYGVTVSFLKKERSVAFQAADLLAYENLKANRLILERGNSGVYEGELRRSLAELSKIPGARSQDWGIYSAEEIMKFCSAYEVQLRVNS